MFGFGKKKKELSLTELNAAFAKHDGTLRAMASFSPDVQGVLLDTDAKTGEPCAKVILAKSGTTKPADIPANVGGLRFKGEYNR